MHDELHQLKHEKGYHSTKILADIYGEDNAGGTDVIGYFIKLIWIIDI